LLGFSRRTTAATARSETRVVKSDDRRFEHGRVLFEGSLNFGRMNLETARMIASSTRLDPKESFTIDYGKVSGTDQSPFRSLLVERAPQVSFLTGKGRDVDGSTVRNCTPG